MSVVSNIIDALRRIGSPADKTALTRQDRQLEGRNILERTIRTIRSEKGSATGFHAVVEPVDEEVRLLDCTEIDSILQNAALAEALFEAFDIDSDHDPLDGLDRSFQAWICSADKRGYSGDAVVEILGAHFGEYCNASLGMRWVCISDGFGTCLAVDGVDAAFRAFPYHSIEKRIADGEHTFFRGIYIVLEDQKQHSSVRLS